MFSNLRSFFDFKRITDVIFRKNLSTLFIRYILFSLSFCRKKWKFLIKKSLQNSKSGLFYVFVVGLCNFIASPPFSVILVLPLTFGSLIYILEKKKVASIKWQLLTISVFLFGYFVGIFWWLFVPLTTDLLHFFWLIPFAIFGLPAVMTLCFVPFFTIGFFVLKKIKTNKNIDYSFAFAVMFIVCWFCGEYVRGHLIFGGFPWMLFGHLIKYAFAFQIVRLIGIDLYSILLLALVFGVYLFFFKKPNRLTQICCLSVFCFWFCNCLFGALFCLFSKQDTFSQIIVGTQINRSSNLNITSSEAIDILNKNINQIFWTARSNKEMIKIMPENAINFHLESGDNIAKVLGKVVGNEKSILLAGGIYEEGLSIYNAVYSINNDGHVVSLYKKQKLVPFGEYIPVRKFMPFLTRTLTNGMVDFSTDGENDLFIFYRDLPIIYPTICYESIFPNYVVSNIKKSRKYIEKNFLELNKIANEGDWGVKIKTLQERRELIVNIVNDAWMKWSVAGYQHFLMTRFLAVATGLPVVRVSNNGISAFIDSRGRVVKNTKLNTEDILFIAPKSKR